MTYFPTRQRFHNPKQAFLVSLIDSKLSSSIGSKSERLAVTVQKLTTRLYFFCSWLISSGLGAGLLGGRTICENLAPADVSSVWSGAAPSPFTLITWSGSKSSKLYSIYKKHES
jgi:hypothetical protein